MRKVSSTPPISQRHSRVAEFIDQRLEDMQQKSRKTIGQIADEAGLPQRNMLSMIRTGVTKLPFDRIHGMAQALEVDMPHLLRLALEEYQPQLNELLISVQGRILTRNEDKILEVWRFATENQDPPVKPLEGELTIFLKRLYANPQREVRA